MLPKPAVLLAWLMIPSTCVRSSGWRARFPFGVASVLRDWAMPNYTRVHSTAYAIATSYATPTCRDAAAAAVGAAAVGSALRRACAEQRSGRVDPGTGTRTCGRLPKQRRSERTLEGVVGSDGHVNVIQQARGDVVDDGLLRLTIAALAASGWIGRWLRWFRSLASCASLDQT